MYTVSANGFICSMSMNVMRDIIFAVFAYIVFHSKTIVTSKIMAVTVKSKMDYYFLVCHSVVNLQKNCTVVVYWITIKKAEQFAPLFYIRLKFIL